MPFRRESTLYPSCNDIKAFFFTITDQIRYKRWAFKYVFDALSYLLDIFYLKFGTKLYRQIVGIPMGTNCAPLIADLVLFCYERDLMDSLSDLNQTDIIEAFNPTLLNIDNFHRRHGQIIKHITIS